MNRSDSVKGFFGVGGGESWGSRLYDKVRQEDENKWDQMSNQALASPDSSLTTEVPLG